VLDRTWDDPGCDVELQTGEENGQYDNIPPQLKFQDWVGTFDLTHVVEWDASEEVDITVDPLSRNISLSF